LLEATFTTAGGLTPPPFTPHAKVDIPKYALTTTNALASATA